MGEQPLGERTASRADFDSQGNTVAARGQCNSFEGFAFDEEMLPERLSQTLR